MFGCKPISASRSASLCKCILPFQRVLLSLSLSLIPFPRGKKSERERRRDGYTHGIQFRIFAKGILPRASGKQNERVLCRATGPPTLCLPPFPVKTAEYSCLDIVKPHFRHYHYVKHVVEADKSNNGARQTGRVTDFSTLRFEFPIPDTVLPSLSRFSINGVMGRRHGTNFEISNQIINTFQGFFTGRETISRI